MVELLMNSAIPSEESMRASRSFYVTGLVRGFFHIHHNLRLGPKD